MYNYIMTYSRLQSENFRHCITNNVHKHVLAYPPLYILSCKFGVSLYKLTCWRSTKLYACYRLYYLSFEIKYIFKSTFGRSGFSIERTWLSALIVPHYVEPHYVVLHYGTEMRVGFVQDGNTYSRMENDPRYYVSKQHLLKLLVRN